MTHSLAKWSLSRANLRAVEMQSEVANIAEADKHISAAEFHQKQQDLEKIIPLRPVSGTEHTKRLSFRGYVHYVTQHSAFTAVVMITIFFNAITIALETTTVNNKDADTKGHEWLEYIDYVFLSIYSVEFLLKCFDEPRGYWYSGYNRFDFFILIVSYAQLAFSGMDVADFTFLRVVRALRALRALRSISFIRSLQVIVNALIETFRTSVLDLILLLFLGMYLFAIMGYYFFGYDDVNSDQEQWGTLGRALMSLFTYVTADGWTDLQRRLDAEGFRGSSWYTITFIFFGHFIFTNLFIGVIIQNIEEATRADKEEQLASRMENLNQKKAFILQRQQEDIANLLEKQRDMEFVDIQDMIKHLAGSLRHDSVPFRHIVGNLQWFETFLTTLDHQENTMFRHQQMHFELANVLAELLERKLSSRLKSSM